MIKGQGATRRSYQQSGGAKLVSLLSPLGTLKLSGLHLRVLLPFHMCVKISLWEVPTIRRIRLTFILLYCVKLIQQHFLKKNCSCLETLSKLAWLNLNFDFLWLPSFVGLKKDPQSQPPAVRCDQRERRDKRRIWLREKKKWKGAWENKLKAAEEAWAWRARRNAAVREREER